MHLLGIKQDPDSFRAMKMGKQLHQRYSPRALRLIRDAKAAGRIEEATAALREHYRAQRRAKQPAR